MSSVDIQEQTVIIHADKLNQNQNVGLLPRRHPEQGHTR